MCARSADCLTLSVEEAAGMLGVSRGVAYEAVHTGGIPSVRVGGRVLVPRGRLLEMLGAVDAEASPGGSARVEMTEAVDSVLGGRFSHARATASRIREALADGDIAWAMHLAEELEITLAGRR